MEPAIEAAIQFYKENYDIVFHHLAKGSERRELGDPNDRVCRFCGRRKPEVAFRKEAHAIPQAFGNRGLTTTYECDACNQSFGGGIETDLGTWSLARRAFSLIRGQHGIPKIRQGSDGGWRIEFKDGRLNVKDFVAAPICDLDELNEKLSITVPVGSYTPVAVFKAFVRIGLTLMPESEIGPFAETLAWIREPDHSKSTIGGNAILHTPQNGPTPPDQLVAFVLRRKPGITGVPYAYLVLGYGNDVFQVILPARAEDASIDGTTFSMVPFPTPGGRDPARYGRAAPVVLVMSEREIRRGTMETLTFGYEGLVKVKLPPKGSPDEAAASTETPPDGPSEGEPQA